MGEHGKWLGTRSRQCVQISNHVLLLLGAALAVGVGFLALGGDPSVLNRLMAYVADGGISADLGGIWADLVQSFSLDDDVVRCLTPGALEHSRLA